MLKKYLTFWKGFLIGVLAGPLLIWVLSDIHGGLQFFELLSYLSEVAIAGFAGFAAFTFFYQKRSDRLSAALHQIALYRNQIIPSNLELERISLELALFIDRKPERIADYNHVWYLQHFPEKFIKYQKNEDILNPNNTSEEKRKEFLRKEHDLFVSIEWFASEIIYTNNTDHEAMKAVKQGFVELVEQYAFRIIIAAQKNKFMQETIDLYLIWRDEVIRDK